MKVVYPVEMLLPLACLCRGLGLVTIESSGLMMVGRYRSSRIVNMYWLGLGIGVWWKC